MAFRLSRDQLAHRRAFADVLREKARALNIAIAAFDRGVEPLAQAVAKAQDAYNETLAEARSLANSIAEYAQEQFGAKSERWQNSDKGIQIRSWIEQWEISLDNVDVYLPEPLEEIDPEEHAGELEDAPAGPVELKHEHSP
jgi:hypothetical protein